MEEEQRICPKCESEDVRYDKVEEGGIEGSWTCNECGYFDFEFPKKEIPELETEEDSFEEMDE